MNAYTIARRLGVGFATPYRVVNAMISNPHVFGITIPHTEVERALALVRRLILSGMPWVALLRRMLNA